MAIYMRENLINYSAELLTQAEYGMTWTKIARFFRKKSAEFKVPVPYENTIFPSNLPNRRMGFIQNLKVFSPEQQLILLHELCDIYTKVDIKPLRHLLRHYDKGENKKE